MLQMLALELLVMKSVVMNEVIVVLMVELLFRYEPAVPVLELSAMNSSTEAFAKPSLPETTAASTETAPTAQFGCVYRCLN